MHTGFQSGRLHGKRVPTLCARIDFFAANCCLLLIHDVSQVVTCLFRMAKRKFNKRNGHAGFILIFEREPLRGFGGTSCPLQTMHTDKWPNNMAATRALLDHASHPPVGFHYVLASGTSVIYEDAA